MSRRAARAGAAAAEAAPLLADLRAELGIPESFDPRVLAEAEDAARQPIPDHHQRADLRDIPFVTLDPPGAADLDQAFFLARAGEGYRLHYAIADVASYVTPGSALDAETHRRGLTYYGPDGRFGLHPAVLSEGAASLLPGLERRAAVWDLTFDADGVMTAARVERAIIRSREQLDYPSVQRLINQSKTRGVSLHDDDDVPEPIALLCDLGPLRLDLQVTRGGASIDVPEQEVVVSENGDRFRLAYRAPLPIEDHNAQLSLAAGIAAARLQGEAGVGIWRTLDPAQDRDIAALRRVARGLDLDWPRAMPYGVFARGLDVTGPAAAAFATEATRLFRGAGYRAFGTRSTDPGVPVGASHSAIAAEYAHVTAPLRRLVDRYGTEVALAHCAGAPVAEWVLAGLDALPAEMAAASQRASAYDRGAIDVLEALIMARHIGQTYDGVVVGSTTPKDPSAPVRATVLVSQPALRLKVSGPREELRPGARVRVVVNGVDLKHRRVDLDLA